MYAAIHPILSLSVPPALSPSLPPFYRPQLPPFPLAQSTHVLMTVLGVSPTFSTLLQREGGREGGREGACTARS